MTIKRRVTIVTTSRADIGIYAPVIAALRDSVSLEVDLFVSGSHVPSALSHAEQNTVTEALAATAQVPIAAMVPMRLGGGDASSIAYAMAGVAKGAASVFADYRPDILVVLGDRYEMHAVVVAASAFRIPVAHIHGGEETEGALDNIYRHSITKLSHLHFCATEMSRLRILQMGEEPWRITVTGAPALDGIAGLPLDSRETLNRRLGIADAPFLLATFHPETVAIANTLPAFDALIAALDEIGMTTVFSRANADEAGQAINTKLEESATRKPWLVIRDNLGRSGYFSAMRHAEAMVGNSSSGIIEAASFGLPVVNIGNRQAGRERSANTIDCEAEAVAISAAIEKARSMGFRDLCRAAQNVYVHGCAGPVIRDVLETVRLDDELLIKRFQLRSRISPIP